MPDLLLELLSEEIPARMQAKAAEDLRRLLADNLKKSGLAYDNAHAFVTPRRLAVAVEGLPAKAPDVTGERKGPKLDAPEQAIEGFRRSLPEGANIEQRDDRKGRMYFATWEEKGRDTPDLLAEAIPAALAALPWPKSMRWGSHAVRWVRPLHSIVALFDGAVVPFAFGPVASGDTTRGHRFMAPDPIPVAGIADYTEKLRAARVLLDREERKALILERARTLCASEGLALREDAGLLEEVAGLVEWPVVLMGRIPDEFMVVPPEVLITAMRVHQRYFPALTASGALAPRFVVVANRETPDDGATVVAGNERVLRARLSDARFFWDQDHKTPLDDRVPKLADMVFHAKLGTVKDKVARIADLAATLAPYCKADPAKARRAAELCKADLVSEMVFEFPEVQGIMGRYLARDEGLDPEVCEALAEHYSPLGPSDACPTAPVSVAVALADKIDTLVGFWAIDEKPTGSKDPFALRRAALGVIRLIVENGLRVPLAVIFEEELSLYRKFSPLKKATFFRAGEEGQLGENITEDVWQKRAVELPSDLLAFFADRLKVHLKERGVRHDLIAAVFALGGEDDLVRLLARVDALSEFLDSADGANLLTAHRRATNILRIEETRDGVAHDGPVDPTALVAAEETALTAALAEVEPAVAGALDNEDFAAAMSALARLRAPVDAFFDHVTVNSEDANLRTNRLRILSRIGAAMQGVADFSKVEG